MEVNNNNGHGRNDKLLLVGTILLIFSLLFITFKPALTGFNTFENTSQATMHIIEFNKTYAINSVENLSINGTITSIKLNGKYSGVFRIWINASGKMLLLAKSESTNSQITGMDVLDTSVEASIDASPAEIPPVATSSADTPVDAPLNVSTDAQADTDVSTNVSAAESAPENTTENISENMTENTIENTTENITFTSNETTIITNETVENVTENVSVNNSTLNLTEPELIEQNITVNVTEQNITQNITENTTQNQTQNISQNVTSTYVMSSLYDECIDTCLLMMNMTNATLVIELSDNSTVTIDSITYTAKNINHPPIQIKDIGDVYLNDTNMFSINLSEYFADEDNDTIIFDSNTIEGITYSVNNNIITYNVSNVSNNYSVFISVSDGENVIQSNIFNIIPNISSNETNETNVTIETIQYPARVGQSVKWIKKVSSNHNVTNISIELPAMTSNITLINSRHERKALRLSSLSDISSTAKPPKYKGQKGKSINATMSEKVSRDVVWENTPVNITLNESSTSVDVEYYTEAPLSSEINTGANSKEVNVYSTTHYANVTAYSNLPIDVRSAEDVILRWKIFNDSANVSDLSSEELLSLHRDGFVYKNISFTLLDLDNDSLYDGIEWVAPHLSNQTFEIIVITTAVHLDENRNYIDDIYNQVSVQDGIWSEVIKNSEYVRVTFERRLTSWNDITLYARSSDGASVEVYGKDGSTKIADFGKIGNERLYKVYLTNLTSLQDTFDLRVVNGSVEFDYITDPYPPLLVAINLNASNVEQNSSVNVSGTVMYSNGTNVSGAPVTIDINGVKQGCAQVKTGNIESGEISKSVKQVIFDDVETHNNTHIDYFQWRTESYGSGGPGQDWHKETGKQSVFGGHSATTAWHSGKTTQTNYNDNGVWVLRPQALDMSKVSSINLSFAGYCNVEPLSDMMYDSCYVDFSNDNGTTWSFDYQPVQNYDSRCYFTYNDHPFAPPNGWPDWFMYRKGYCDLIYTPWQNGLNQTFVVNSSYFVNNFTFRFVQTADWGTATTEGFYVDDINLTYIIDNDSATLYKEYNDVSSDMTLNNITEVDVTVQVKSYNPTGSVSAGNARPDLEVSLWNGTNYVDGQLLYLNETYTGNTLNATVINFTTRFTDYAALKNWASNLSIRDIAIRGVYFDTESGYNDEINWTGVYIALSNASTVTDANGAYSFIITAPSSGGNYSVNAKASYSGSVGTNTTSLIVAGDDLVYPTFSNYWDNNATLGGSGIGLFNVTVNNTNGTVWLVINNTNITAINVSGNVYNASYYFSFNGTYSYAWHALGSGGWHNHNVSDTRSYVVNPNTPPSIVYVQPITAVDPLEYSLRTIPVNFTVNDVDGSSTINISSAKAVVSQSSVSRQSTAGACSGISVNTTAVNISCNVSMQYYDIPGVWSINLSISDNSASYVENTSTTFTYNILYAINLNTNSLDFGSLNVGDVNRTAGTLVLNNTGNFNYTLVQLKAYNLINGTYLINVSNFRINITNVSTGAYLINNTYVNVTGAMLSRCTDSGCGNQSMYMYVDVPLGTAAKKFTSSSSWVLSLS